MAKMYTTPSGVEFEGQDFTEEVVKRLRFKYQPGPKGAFPSPEAFNIYSLLAERDDLLAEIARLEGILAASEAPVETCAEGGEDQKDRTPPSTAPETKSTARDAAKSGDGNNPPARGRGKAGGQQQKAGQS